MHKSTRSLASLVKLMRSYTMYYVVLIKPLHLDFVGHQAVFYALFIWKI